MRFLDIASNGKAFWIEESLGRAFINCFLDSFNLTFYSEIVSDHKLLIKDHKLPKRLELFPKINDREAILRTGQREHT